MTFKTYILLGIIGLLPSCHPFYGHIYTMENKSKSPLSVYIETDFDTISDTLEAGEILRVFEDFTSKDELYCNSSTTLQTLKKYIIRDTSGIIILKDMNNCDNWNKTVEERKGENYKFIINYNFIIQENDLKR